MRTVRIYQPGIYKVADKISLTQSATQHVAVVLRMAIGEHLVLFSGTNEEYSATIIEVSKKIVRVRIDELKKINRESPLKIHLLPALCKLERMEWIIQKAVELGVRKITPLTTARSVLKFDEARSEKKLSQWEAISVNACEQCGRNSLPKISPILSLKKYLSELAETERKATAELEEIKFFMHPETKLSLKAYSEENKLTAVTKISVLIGPEGGLNEEEIEQLQAQGFIGLSLGPRILRAETAVVTAISLLQARWGDI